MNTSGRKRTLAARSGSASPAPISRRKQMTVLIRNATLVILYLVVIADVLQWVSSFATDEGPRLIADGIRAIYVLTFVTAIGLAALVAGKSGPN